jgi:hypothetical protein
MATIKLNVVSMNNAACTAHDEIFDTMNMSGIQANQSLSGSPTMTEAGDTAAQMSNWTIYGPVTDGTTLYWAFTFSGTTRNVRVYRNSTFTDLLCEGSATIANGNAGTVYLRTKNESGFYGQVTVTIAGGGATTDADPANTLTYSGVVSYFDLNLPGASEFAYELPNENVVKYTVTETPDQIIALAGGFTLYTGEEVGVIDFATTGATTGASYIVQRADGLGDMTIPEGAVIMNAWYNVNTTFKSATDAATIAIGVETDDATGIVAATAISAGGNVWDAGIHQALPDFATVADYTTAATAVRNIIYTLAGAEDLTAGKLHLHIAYAIMV